MTKFLDPSFSTYAPGDQTYRDNWEAVFGKKKDVKCASDASVVKAAKGITKRMRESKKPEPPKEPELMECGCDPSAVSACHTLR